MPKKILLDSKKIHLILSRLVYELIENHKDFKDTVLIGLQPRGVYLFNQILKVEKTLSANSTQINFTLENKRIVLIDDVLFTGRSIKAAMSAIDSYGRPKSIELLVLVDRRFKREIPIEANYCGTKIDTFKGDKVKVIWDDKPVNNKVFIES